MSLSNPKAVNPAAKFIEFKGDTGTFQFYDKSLEEPKNVTLDMPLFFIVLDELSTITGWSEKLESNIYSNEVHSLTDEILKVKSFKGGFTATGKYRDIKDSIVANGGKFTKSVYAMLITGKDSFELVHFKIVGSSFQGWLEKTFNTQAFGVQVKSTYQTKKGKTVYQVPVFEKVNIPKDKQNIWDAALEMDKNLQIYLKAYKAGQLEKMEVQEVVENQQDDNWPMGNKEKANSQRQQEEPTDDLPF
jgi:hypothetical protein